MSNCAQYGCSYFHYLLSWFVLSLFIEKVLRYLDSCETFSHTAPCKTLTMSHVQMRRKEKCEQELCEWWCSTRDITWCEHSCVEVIQMPHVVHSRAQPQWSTRYNDGYLVQSFYNSYKHLLYSYCCMFLYCHKYRWE